MGVDWIACEKCSGTFPDCGHYYTCSECERNYCQRCGDKFSEKYPFRDEEHEEEASDTGNLANCDFCTLEEIPPDNLIIFAADQIGVTVEELEEMYRDEYK